VRPDEGIEMDEVDEEFEHHINASAADLVRQGADPVAARAQAERRFGARDRLHQCCVEEQLENPMKRTREIVLLVAVAVLAVVAVDGWRRSVQSQRLLGESRALLEEVVGRARSGERSDGTDDGDPSPGATATLGVIYVDGAVARPGVYQLPEGGRLTASRLIAAAGGAAPHDSIESCRVTRFETTPSGEPHMREYRMSLREAESFTMQRDDHLVVASRGAADR